MTIEGYNAERLYKTAVQITELRYIINTYNKQQTIL